MDIEKINVGAAPGDGSGDTVRVAFEKVNDNFDLIAEMVLARLVSHTAFTQMSGGREDFVPRFLEDGPPDRIPTVFGALWIDASNSRIYLSTGTRSRDDWRELAFVGGSQS